MHRALAGHGRAESGIGGGGEQLLDLGRIEMRGDARIGGEQIGEGPAFDERRLRRVIDDVMRMLPPESETEIEYHRLSDDEAVAEIEILAQSLGIELQPV